MKRSLRSGRRGVFIFFYIGFLSCLPVLAHGQAASVDAARKEGKVVWYTSLNIDASRPLIDAFEKKVPFVKVQLLRLSAETVVSKIITEEMAGRAGFDLVAVNAFQFVVLKEKGLIQPYLSPERAAYKKGFKDPSAYWVDL